MKSFLKLGILLFCSAVPLFARAGALRQGTDRVYFDMVVRFEYSDARGQAFWEDYFDILSEDIWKATNGHVQLGTVDLYMNQTSMNADMVVHKEKTSGGSTNPHASLGGLLNISFMKVNPAVGDVNFSAASSDIEVDAEHLLGWGPYVVIHEMGHYIFGLADAYLLDVWDSQADFNAATYSYSATAGSYVWTPALVFSNTSAWPDPGFSYAGFLNPTDLNNDQFIMGSCRKTAADWNDDRVNNGCENREFTKASDEDFGTTSHDFDGDGDNDFHIRASNTLYHLRNRGDWETIEWVLGEMYPTFAVTIPAVDDFTTPPGYVPITMNYHDEGNSLVMVYDISGSMAGSRIDLAQDAGELYLTRLENTAQVGDKLGLVSFNTVAATEYALHEFTDASDIAAGLADAKTALNALDSKVGGNTSIGAGLGAGLAEFQATTQTGIEAMILLSDGKHNTPPAPSSKYADLAARGVIVHTIAIGDAADQEMMSEIASNTGGRYRYVQDASGLSAIFDEIAGISIGHFQIMEMEQTVNTGASVTVPVTLESGLKAAAFTVYGSDLIDMDLSVNINGTLYTSSSPNVQWEDGSSYMTMVIPNPVGVNANMIISNAALVARDIKARASGVLEETPARLIVDQSAQFIDVGGEVILSLEFVDGIYSLSGIDAEIELISPSGAHHVLTPADHGISGDAMAGDGVYSVRITSLAEIGTWQIIYRAESFAGTSSYADGYPGGPNLPAPVYVSESKRRTSVGALLVGHPSLQEEIIEVGSCNITYQGTGATAINTPFSPEPQVGDYIYRIEDGPEYAVKIIETPNPSWYAGFWSTPYQGAGGDGNCAMIRNHPDENSSFVCSGDCLDAIEMTSSYGVLNSLDDVWFKVTAPIQGWQVSEFDGRSIYVNGELVTPGQMPLPKSVGGVYYFHMTAGDKSWASWIRW